VSYTALAGMGVLVAVVVDQLLLRTNLLRRKAFWTAYGLILIGQLIVNGLLTGLRIVRYDPNRILGWHVVYAPVEDLLFGFSMVTVTLATWVWLGRRGLVDRRRHGQT
jgi:lycopene cyclase domain-containing protein